MSLHSLFVIDAERVDDGVRLELTITAGAHKGDVVAVRARTLTMDPIDALGIPARIVVTNNEPRVELHRVMPNVTVVSRSARCLARDDLDRVDDDRLGGGAPRALVQCRVRKQK